MPGVAVCDNSCPRRWVVRHQHGHGLNVAGLWRYPVKTLAGERLSTAAVGFAGIFGDRALWVVGPEGVWTSAGTIACRAAWHVERSRARAHQRHRHAEGGHRTDREAPVASRRDRQEARGVKPRRKALHRRERQRLRGPRPSAAERGPGEGGTRPHAWVTHAATRRSS